MTRTAKKIYRLRKQIDNLSLEYHLLQDKHIDELERNEKICDLRNDGWTYQKLSNKFNLCVTTIRKIYNTPEELSGNEILENYIKKEEYYE